MSVDCKLILNSLLQRINDAVQETINSLETQTDGDEIQTLNKKNKENINVVKIKTNDFSKQKLRNGKKKDRMVKHIVQTANTLNTKAKKDKRNIDSNGLSRKGFSLLSILSEPNPNNNSNPKNICNDNKPPRKYTLQSKKGDFKKMETIKELLELLEEKKEVKVNNTKKTVKNNTYTVFPIKDDYRFCSSEKMLQSINFENESDDEGDDSSGTSNTSDASDTSDTECTSSSSGREGYETNYGTNYGTGYGTNYGATDGSNYVTNYGENYAGSCAESYGTSYGGSYEESSVKAYAQNFTQNGIENNLQSYNNYTPQYYANNYAGSNAQHFVDNYTENNNQNLIDNNTNYYTENNLQSCIADYTDDDEVEDNEQNFVGNFTDNGTQNNNYVNTCKNDNSELNKKEFVDNYTNNYAENYVKPPVCAVSIATGMENVTPVFTNCVQTSPRGSYKLLKADKRNSPCFVLTPSMTSEEISSLQIVCDNLPMEFAGNNNSKKRKGFFSKLFRRSSKCTLKKSKVKVPDSSQTVCVRNKLSTISYDSSEPNSETNVLDKHQPICTNSGILEVVNPKPVFTEESQKETTSKAPKLICPRCNKPLNYFAPRKSIMTKDTHTCMRQPFVRNTISSGLFCKNPKKVCSKKLVTISTSPIKIEKEPRCKRLAKNTSSTSTSCESIVTVRRTRSCKPNLKKIEKVTFNDASTGPKETICPPLSHAELGVSTSSQPAIQNPEDRLSPQPKIQKQDETVTPQPAKEKLDSTIPEPTIKKHDDLATALEDKKSEDSIIPELPVQKDKKTSISNKSKYSMIPKTSIKEPDDLDSLISDTEAANVEKVTIGTRTKISSKQQSTSTTGLRTKENTAQIATGTSDLNIKRDSVEEKLSPIFTQSYSLSDSTKDNNLKLKSEHQCKDCDRLRESFNSLLRAMLSIALKQNGTTQFKSNAKSISDQFSNGTGDGNYLYKQKRQKYYDRDEDSYRMDMLKRKRVNTSRNHKDLSSKIKNLDEVLQGRLLEPYLDHLLSEEPLRKVKARNYFSPCSGKCGKEIYHCVHNNPLIYSLAKYLKRDRVFNDDISDYLKFLKKTSCSFGGVHVNRCFRC